jgi:hypothetical protein
LFADLDMMIKHLTRKNINIDDINKHFSAPTMSKYTLMQSHFYFRAMLISMYWDNIFQPLSLQLLISQAREMDAKVTNGYGYRGKLLASCMKIQDAQFFHSKQRDVSDYPILKPNIDRVNIIAEAKLQWAKEKQQLEVSHDWAATRDTTPSAQSILQKNGLAEQVYAFGYQITEMWARTDL